MGNCQGKRAFENGGAVSKADQLIAEMNAKYGVSGNAQPAPQPVQAPVPQPQPAPQPQQRGIVGNALELISGRQRQIDKASGYANGGKIAGPGTPTSDSIPATVSETGEPIKVSTDERIVSKAQDNLLQVISKGLGFDSLDAMLEAGTGKPVGPTIKAGKRAAANGLSPDEEKNRAQAFSPPVPTLGTGLQGMSRVIAESAVAPPVATAAPAATPEVSTGRNASGVITAESASAAMGNDMQRSGGISGTIDMKGVNGILESENKARGEMIDSMVRANGGNGVAVLPDPSQGGSTQMMGKMDSLIDEARKTGRSGQKILDSYSGIVRQQMQNDSQAASQVLTARGQDLGFQNDLARNQIAMRGQDINAQTDAVRMGIDSKRLGLAQTADDRAADRWSVERPGIVAQAKDSDAVRSARQGLMDAIASGDQKAIDLARAKAVAAGIKFDKPNNEYVTTTDSMGMNITRTNKDTGAVDVIEGKSGKVKASIPGPGAQQVVQAPVPQGFTVVGTSNGKRVLQDAQGKRFVEGN